MGIPEGKEKEKGTEEILEIMTGYFPNLLSDTKPQVQAAHRTPSRINTKKTKPNHT